MFRPLNEVKPCAAGLVLEWVTKFESPCSNNFFSFPFVKLEEREERNELPSFYKRSVDDTFTIVPDLKKANAFLDKLDSCHENFNFTKEIAEQDTIPFVCMNIT